MTYEADTFREALKIVEEISAGRKMLAITDKNVETLVDFPASLPVYALNPGEDSKSVDSLVAVWKFLVSRGATRQSLIINVGGGMVTDLGGFASATFMRGVDYVNIPTTLLGAVDAATGGKTGINLLGLKNEVGAFRLPFATILVPSLFSTLPRQEILSGYGEMLKAGFLHSAELADRMLSVSPTADSLGALTMEALKVKEDIVARDPEEMGLRKVLNLGHTVGHAFEEVAMKQQHPVPHGVAVAYGLLAELVLAHIHFCFPSEWLYRLSEKLKSEFPPLCYDCSQYEWLLELMGGDKKNDNHGEILFSLPESPGKCHWNVFLQTEEICNGLDICRDLLGI